MNFTLDYDEGTWLLTVDGHDFTTTIHMRDDEAFALNAALKQVREREAEIADMKQIYKGMVQAGMAPRHLGELSD